MAMTPPVRGPALATMILAVLALTACGTPRPKDFGGRWKPVNRFQANVVELPLRRDYHYFAAPLDQTLRTMLARWSHDNGLVLDYQLRSDFSLPSSAGAIQSTDIHAVLNAINNIFAPQSVNAQLLDGHILVTEIQAGAPSS